MRPARRSGATRDPPGPTIGRTIDPPVNVKCGSGLTQSPIETRPPWTQVAYAVPTFDYRNENRPVIVKNTSRELKVQPMFDGKMTFGTNVARLVQFHFHVRQPNPQTEHKLNLDDWNAARAELHLVHETSTGQTFVVAMAIGVGSTNPALVALRRFVPLQECHSRASRTTQELVPMGRLLPAPSAAGRFIYYEGSLTTPPCTEGVRFLLMKDVIYATESEIDAMMIGAGNIRPTQTNRNTVTERRQ